MKQIETGLRYALVLVIGASLGVGALKLATRHAKNSHAESTRKAVAVLESSRSLRAHYHIYQEEILETLRRQRSVRLVRLEAPSAILSYQRSPADLPSSDYPMLRGSGTRIPVIAVSRNAQHFLERLRIHQVDPRTLPPELLRGFVPALKPSALMSYVLMPDLSGAHESAFYFQRN